MTINKRRTIMKMERIEQLSKLFLSFTFLLYVIAKAKNNIILMHIASYMTGINVITELLILIKHFSNKK